MIKLIIKNINLPYPQYSWDTIKENIEKGNEFIDSNKHLFGKPERWVQAKELMENGNPEEPEHWMWYSEYYEDSDIIRSETRADEQTGEPITMVLLKADYIIEIIDLDKDYDYLLNQCMENRKREYPPVEELANALFWKEQGDDSKYIEYMKKCEDVKLKYPKPIKEVE